jgi:hypothetical protein
MDAVLGCMNVLTTDYNKNSNQLQDVLEELGKAMKKVERANEESRKKEKQ